MDLLKTPCPFDLYHCSWLILTVEEQGSPARVVAGPSGRRPDFRNSVLSSGTVIAGGKVASSILGWNVRVEEGAVVTRSILGNRVAVGRIASVRN